MQQVNDMELSGLSELSGSVSDYIVENATSFLRYPAPVREFLLYPWLTSQSLNMIYSWRGVGKTHIALSIAHSIATATEFLGWKPKKQGKVL